MLFVSLNRKRLLKISTSLLSILSVSVFSLYLLLPKVVGAHIVRSNPQVFEGNMGVMGELTVNDNGEMYFIIKCKQRKKFLSVKYPANTHLIGTNAIAYGKLEKERTGEYCFCAEKIISKNDDLAGSLVYLLRSFFESPRRWIHDNLPMVIELIKSLFTRG